MWGDQGDVHSSGDLHKVVRDAGVGEAGGGRRHPAWRSSSVVRLSWIIRRGRLCTVLDGGELDINPDMSYNDMGDFFPAFLESLRVWFGSVKQQHSPRVGIMVSPSYPYSVGVCFASEGCVEPCLGGSSGTRPV